MMSVLHGHISDSPTLNLLYMLHIKPVVPSSQPEQNNVLWPAQFVEAVCLAVMGEEQGPYVWPLREFLPLNVSTPARSTPCRRTDFDAFFLILFYGHC